MRRGTSTKYWNFLDAEGGSSPGCPARYGSGETRVDLGRDAETPLCGDEGVLLYRVTGVVRGQLTQGKIALGEERLLNTTVTIAVQREGGVVQSHVPQSALEPLGELVPDDGGELAAIERRLEHRSSSSAVLLAVNPHELQDGGHRTELRVVSSSQGDFVDSLPELVVLRLGDGKYDALVDVVVQRLDVVPAQDHVQVDLARRLDQVARAKHTQIVNK